ncbi:hypothetical protein NC653_029670 [Populus alba x Populus x berolinensis]|uniref:Uncharacterized protein n=1 Tax=Populus alba x Populus x berolinensis TaxID=444605 RepID=A0AAD6Q3S0_9ROSI|nr:hypothetical protein NC653_029670 [Populus alba x Populus x berolinensis]
MQRRQQSITSGGQLPTLRHPDMWRQFVPYIHLLTSRVILNRCTVNSQ